MIQNSGSNGKGKAFFFSENKEKTCNEVKQENKEQVKTEEKRVAI